MAEQGKRDKFHLILTVWGQAYINLFLNVSLPSLLAEGNLPALYSSGKNDFYIYTRKEDIGQFEANKAFSRCKDYLNVIYVNINEEFPGGNSWTIMTDCHNHAVRLAYKQQAAIVILIPDFIYSAGFVQTMLRRYQEGYNAVIALQIAAKRDVFLAELFATQNGPSGVISIEPRTLLALWQKHRHPMADFYGCDSTHYPNYPPCLLRWQLDNNSFLVRSTQFTPFLIHAENDFQLRNDDKVVETLDTVMVKNLVNDPERVYIIDDSDDGVHVEMRPATEEYAVPYDRPNVPVLAFCLNQFRINGRGDARYLDRKVYFHINELDRDAKAVQTADEYYAVIKDLSLFDASEQFLEKLKNYYQRLVGERKLIIVGRGYVAEVTVEFFRTFDLTVERADDMNGVSPGSYVVLTDQDTFEQASFHLTVQHRQYERDYMLSPLAFRLFRLNVFKGSSWKRYYYDHCRQYSESVQKYGIIWALKRIKNKLCRS